MAENALYVTHDRYMYHDVLAYGRRVDIDMNYPGIGGEFGHVACNPVVEARPDGQDEIRIVDGHVGLERTVHPQHTQEERMVCRETSQFQEGIRHRDLVVFRKL